MAGPLQYTKLQLPPARPGLVLRPHLFDALDMAFALHTPLALISAPAGSGKTTVAAEWLRRATFRGAWLALDELDNDPARFWHHLVEALHAGGSDAGASLRPVLEASQVPPLDSLVAALANDLSAEGMPLALVLDDYHLISSQAVHSALDALLDRLPESVVVAIGTRTDPPLALARRRARGQLLELRLDDLRFTEPEVAVFVHQATGIALPQGSSACLQRKTEGWAAGVQLAVLSIRRHGDAATFIESLAGDDRQISDYLLREVFEEESPRVRRFLLRTAVLGRFSAPLCAAVTGEPDCAELLAYLEGANLFLVPLDSNRRWFRYHALFAEMLRQRLFATETPAALDALIGEACAWLEGEDMLEEAVSLAIASPCSDLAGVLLERHILALFFRCSAQSAHAWLTALGDAKLREHPLLCAVYANVIAHLAVFSPRALPLTELWLQEAESGCARLGGARELTRGFIALSYAYLALWRKEAPAFVVERAREALESLPPLGAASLDPSYMRLRSGLLSNLGMSYMNAGDLAAAVDSLDSARGLGAMCGDLLNAYTAAAYKCQILRRQGQLQEAATLCRDTLASLGPSPFGAATHIALASILLEWNDLDAAETQLQKGLQLGRVVAGSGVGPSAAAVQAQLLAVRGDMPGALATIDAAQAGSPESHAALEAHRMRLRLLHAPEGPRLLDALGSWASRSEFASLPPPQAMVLARVLIGLRKAGRIAARSYAGIAGLGAFLEQSIATAESAGDTEGLIELSMLACLAKWGDGDQEGALEALGRSLTLAKPGGYVRLYLDEGAPLHALISALVSKFRRRAGEPQWAAAVDYGTRLLACFVKRAGPTPGQTLLFPRELEVLRMASTGATNAHIARELFISVHTVKKHLTNAFSKIGASSRVQAAEIARDLGLLP